MLETLLPHYALMELVSSSSSLSTTSQRSCITDAHSISKPKTKKIAHTHATPATDRKGKLLMACTHTHTRTPNSSIFSVPPNDATRSKFPYAKDSIERKNTYRAANGKKSSYAARLICMLYYYALPLDLTLAVHGGDIPARRRGWLSTTCSNRVIAAVWCENYIPFLCIPPSSVCPYFICMCVRVFARWQMPSLLAEPALLLFFPLCSCLFCCYELVSLAPF